MKKPLLIFVDGGIRRVEELRRSCRASDGEAGFRKRLGVGRESRDVLFDV